jgi:hypothetical protein
VGWVCFNAVGGTVPLPCPFCPRTHTLVACVGASVTLALALACVRSDGGVGVILLRSVDHGHSYVYAGTLLTPADAKPLGWAAPALSAPCLFTGPPGSGANGTAATLLSVSPSAALAVPPGLQGYDGCLVMTVAPGGVGVVRDGAGVPVVRAYLKPGGAERFAGACAYAAGTPALGVLLPTLFTDQAGPPFRVLASGVSP